MCVAFGLARTLLRWGRRLRATRRPDDAIRLTAGPGSVASAIRGLPPVVRRAFSTRPRWLGARARSPAGGEERVRGRFVGHVSCPCSSVRDRLSTLSQGRAFAQARVSCEALGVVEEGRERLRGGIITIFVAFVRFRTAGLC